MKIFQLVESEILFGNCVTNNYVKRASLSDLQRDDDSSILTEASLFENLARRGEARRPAPSATTTTLSPQPADVVAAIFTGRRGVGNAVCRNFLFPLGWPACGVNSTLPLSRGEKGARNFDALSRSALEVGQGERQRPGRRHHRRSLGNGAHTTAALPPAVPDQMTRASAHNNGLFTLQPLSHSGRGPGPLSTDHDSLLKARLRVRIRYRSLDIKSSELDA